MGRIFALFSIKNNRLFTVSLLYTASSFLSMGINFILVPFYTDLLSIEEFGKVSALTIFFNFFVIISVGGTDSMVARFYFDYYKNPKDLKLFLGSTILQMFSGGVLLNILIILVLVFVSKTIVNIDVYPYIIMLLVAALVGVPSRIIIQYFRVKEKVKYYLAINIGYTLCFVLLNIVFILGLKYGVNGYIYSLLISNLLFGLISFIIILNVVSVNFNKNNMYKALKFSWPFIPHDISNIILRSFDVLFVSQYISFEMTGKYSLAWRVVSIIEILLVSFNNTWNPIFMRLAIYSKMKAKLIISKITTVYFIGLTSIILFVSAFSKQIILIIANDEYIEAELFIAILSVGLLFKGGYFLTTQHLIFKKRMRALPIATITSSLVFLFINMAFGKLFTAADFSIIKVGSSFLLFIIIYINANKVFNVRYEYWKILLFVSMYLLFTTIIKIELYPDYESIINISLVFIFCSVSLWTIKIRYQRYFKYLAYYDGKTI
jgi:O-antigen/teichoic acid export membrane protein